MMSERIEKGEILSKNGARLNDAAVDARLRRLMAQYERFSPVLSRFLAKKFGFSPDVSLQRVERTTLFGLKKRENCSLLAGRISVETFGVPFFILWDERLIPILLDRMQGGDLSPLTTQNAYTAPTPLDCALIATLCDQLAPLLGSFWREEFRLGKTSIGAGPEENEWDEKSYFFIFSWEIRQFEQNFLLELYLPSVLASVISDFEGAEASETELTILAGRVPWSDCVAQNLAAGEILPTQIPADAFFEAVFRGRTVFWVRPGEFQGEAAVEIVAPGDSALFRAEKRPN